MMDLLTNYGDENKGYQEISNPTTSLNLYKPICSAPSVELVQRSHPKLIHSNDSELMTNPKADIVLAPIHGPAHPFRFNAGAPGAKLSGMGHIEETLVEDYAFDEQYQTYQRSGYAVNMSTNQIIGDYNQYMLNQGDTSQNAKRI